jgi:predicted amidophosphoribosyltransferase
VKLGRRKLRTKCSLCGGDLKVYEQPEGICDKCLRSAQSPGDVRA